MAKSLGEALVEQMKLVSAGRVMTEVATERARQIAEEGWSSAHDDKHPHGILALAGVAYAFHAAVWNGTQYTKRLQSSFFPFDKKWWKPVTPRRDLVKAAALIVAEIERMDREAAKNQK